MTAFNTSMLPTGDRECTTLEELACWIALSLKAVNPTEKVVLTAGQAGVNMLQSTTGIDADNTEYRINYCAIKLDPAKQGSSLPAWKQVLPWGSTALPTSYQG